MNQLQLSECAFAINSRIQPDGRGSTISRFFLRGVRGGLPKSLDRSLDWKCLMENRRQAQLRRVERKGRCTSDTFSVGERVRIQNIQSKLWDREEIITGVRISADGTIVSYDIDIGGNHLTRHFIRKLNLPNVQCDDASVEMSNADSGDLSGGGDSEGAGRQGQCADEGVILSEPVRAGQGPLRRSPRLQFTAGPGRRH